MNLDPRIGTLNGGKFYAFAQGYDKPEVVGTLPEVMAALGLPAEAAAKPAAAAAPGAQMQEWTVTLRFQHPAWDEIDGYVYAVIAPTKSAAIVEARKRAADDGHAIGGRGRYWFTAVEVK